MDLRIKTDITTEVLTHSDVSGYLKYEDDETTENALIDLICKAVRTTFEKRVRLAFAEKTLQAHFKYDDKPYILPVSPVISVESVKTVDHEGTEATLTLNSEYWKRGKYEIEIITESMSTISNPFTISQMRYDLLVEFKAGYGHDDTETIPEDLKQAMKMQIMQWYDNRDDFFEGQLLKSVSNILNRYETNAI